ncbi:MAG TPA: long-chain fatty acid--CoA ligase [Gemmatimonadales bacterium]|nr:long-chain fatty acid--CoA ligase [Gemmatimonadales bacterium]
MTAGTLTGLFFDAVARFGPRPALRHKIGGRWETLSHDTVAERVRAHALALRELGVQAGDRVAILSENRPEWALTDYACLCSRAADVPIYPTLPPKQVEYILRDSEAVAVFCSTNAQVEKVLSVRSALPALRHIIAFDEAPDGVRRFADLETLGLAAVPRYPAFQADAVAADPTDVATLIYTSGTTGDPKGVMLSHQNLWSNIMASRQVIAIGDTDECLSMLPLSHVFERMVAYTMFHAGVVINYAESFDLVRQNLLEIRPTVVLSVPRFYEKIHAAVVEQAHAGGRVKNRIFHWAARAGDAWATYRLAGLRPPPRVALRHALADRLVFAKLRARTGGRVRLFVSGGAPLAPNIAKFMFAAGLPVVEGYGLTETSPVLTINPLDRIKIGTVGQAIPEVELRIAADGEILTKGPGVMLGYYNQPQATREAIDAEGWFHTGDVGELDADGYLKITDRKKDLIVTAGGKNIAPQPIENLVKASKFVLNAVMLGDRRRFPVMLVVPNFQQLERWARERRLAFGSHAELIALPDAHAKMEREVMGSLHDRAKFEMPKRVALLERDFTIEAGELTPTLKVKRRAVEQHYKALVDELYADGEAAGGLTP